MTATPRRRGRGGGGGGGAGRPPVRPDPSVKLAVVPTTWRQACAFVAAHHRHSSPTQGQRWALAALADGRVCGVAQCGRPVARMLDDGLTCEVLRCCTDGTANCCSLLY